MIWAYKCSTTEIVGEYRRSVCHIAGIRRGNSANFYANTLLCNQLCMRHEKCFPHFCFDFNKRNEFRLWLASVWCDARDCRNSQHPYQHGNAVCQHSQIWDCLCIQTHTHAHSAVEHFRFKDRRQANIFRYSIWNGFEGSVAAARKQCSTFNWFCCDRFLHGEYVLQHMREFDLTKPLVRKGK